MNRILLTDIESKSNWSWKRIERRTKIETKQKPKAGTWNITETKTEKRQKILFSKIPKGIDKLKPNYENKPKRNRNRNQKFNQ